MHSKSDNIEILIGNETDEIIEDLNQISKRIRRSNERKRICFNVFCFCDNVDSLYYKIHKISLNRGGSYIDSPD